MSGTFAAMRASSRSVAAIKLVVMSLVPALVLFGSAEIISSLVIARQTKVSIDEATGAKRYTMQIGRGPWAYRGVTPLNTLGFPDHEFADLPPKGACIHVVFSGDSFVFGDGVDKDRSFVQLVRRWSDERNAESCIRFFNVAERMTSIDQQAQRISETLPLLQPDIVILGQYQNDLSDLEKYGFMERERGRESRSRELRDRLRIFSSSLVNYFSYRLFAFFITHDIQYDVLSQWSILERPGQERLAQELKQTYRELYGELVHDVRDSGIELGTLIFPSKFDLLAGRSPEEPFFVALAEEFGVPHKSLMPVLDADRANYAYLMYDGHLNQHGNFVVAESVWRWLFESTPAPFEKLRRHSAYSAGLSSPQPFQ